MEGGRVDRFRNIIGPSPSAADVFATGDRKLFRKHGKVIGESCRTLGFNTDFAPVVDLAFEAFKNGHEFPRRFRRSETSGPLRPGISRRDCAQRDVIGSAKHFPGLGEANLDTHHGTPVDQQVVEEALGGRPVSLPDFAP